MKLDRSFAVQCLTHILERTTKLLVTAGSGGKWGKIAMVDIRALPEISSQFVEACGLRTSDTNPLPTSQRAALQQRRLLGELHVEVSKLLVACAHENATRDDLREAMPILRDASVAPEMGEAFGAKHAIYRVHEIAVEFAASVSES